MAAGVVAVKSRIGKCSSHGGDSDSATAAYVGDQRPFGEFLLDAIEPGDEIRDQRLSGPRPQHAFGAVSRIGAQVLVAQPDSRLEGFGELIEGFRVHG